MVRFYSSIYADDKMFIRQMSCDSAFHGSPHQIAAAHRTKIEMLGKRSRSRAAYPYSCRKLALLRNAMTFEVGVAETPLHWAPFLRSLGCRPDQLRCSRLSWPRCARFSSFVGCALNREAGNSTGFRSQLLVFLDDLIASRSTSHCLATSLTEVSSHGIDRTHESISSDNVCPKRRIYCMRSAAICSLR